MSLARSVSFYDLILLAQAGGHSDKEKHFHS